MRFPGKWAVIPVLSAVMLILAGPQAWVNQKILSKRIVVWFGLISFPLYLWHLPLLSFSRIVEGETPSRSIRIAFVLLSVFLAWLTYSLVERPIRLGGHKKIKATGLILFMFAVGYLGYNTYSHDGYEFRRSIKGFVNNKNELIRTPSTDSDCLAYVGIKSPLFPYCRFTSANSNETIAVIGDSHAHVAYPGISEFLKKNGKNTVLLANSGCAPFLGSPTGRNQTEIDACTSRVEQLLEVVESKKDIRKVFIFTRGPIYASGTEPVSGNKDIMSGVSVISLEKFVNSAQLSINRLARGGKLVFYVTENPELRFRPDSCLVRPFKFNVKDCSVQKDSVSSRQEDYRNAFSKLGNVIFIDSLPVFCPGSRCLVFDENGVLLYADDDHLSVAGSKFQAEKLLRPFLE